MNKELWCYKVTFYINQRQKYTDYFPGYNQKDARFAAQKLYPELGFADFVVEKTDITWEEYLRRL